uniref:Uncharacterized protein n=1 Tax=Ciona savignyi TaxID=51511 RepID=H2ZPI6_CIOSA
MRVLTQDRPVTESRMIAEMEMNPAVIGTFATQYAAQLALDGEVDEAKELTQAHKDLIGRGMNLKSQAAGAKAQSEQIYESVQKRMDNITEELAKVDTSSSYGSIEEEESYEDVNVDQSLGDDEVYERLPHQAVGPHSTNLPPALPPRGYQAGKSKSTSSIT